MSSYKNNIIGVGCDFQTESDENSRKLAIESLSGGEKQRVSWMIKNMHTNKVFKYKAQNKTDKQIDKIKAYLFSIFNSLNNLNEKIVIIRFKKEL